MLMKDLRVENSSASGKKNPDEKPSLIIEHPDVRRMLLLQKSMSEGSMSLVFLAAKYYDLKILQKLKKKSINTKLFWI